MTGAVTDPSTNPQPVKPYGEESSTGKLTLHHPTTEACPDAPSYTPSVIGVEPRGSLIECLLHMVLCFELAAS